MGTTLRRAFEGTGPFPALALVALAVGTMFLVLSLQSTSGLVWTGKAIHGQEEGGLVYFTYRGHVYTVDDLGSYTTGPRTVYIDPNDPTRNTLDTTIGSTIQDGAVLGPYLAALVFAGVAGRRKARYRRRRAEPRDETRFGSGVDDDTMARLLDRQRYGHVAGWAPAPPASSASSLWERPANR